MIYRQKYTVKNSRGACATWGKVAPSTTITFKPKLYTQITDYEPKITDYEPKVYIILMIITKI